MATALNLPTTTLSSSTVSPSRKQNGAAGDNSREHKQLERSQINVQRHVESHLAVTKQHTSPPNYQYRAIDGQRYVVSGDVIFDTSVNTYSPQAMLKKALLIQMASMAPTAPTQQDRGASQQAAMIAAQASNEINIATNANLGRYIDIHL